jgi:hypothetical protein
MGSDAFPVGLKMSFILEGETHEITRKYDLKPWISGLEP